MTAYCSCETPVMDPEHDAGCRRCGLPVDFSPRTTICLMVEDGSGFDATGDEYRVWYDDGEPTGSHREFSSRQAALNHATVLAERLGVEVAE